MGIGRGGYSGGIWVCGSVDGWLLEILNWSPGKVALLISRATFSRDENNKCKKSSVSEKSTETRMTGAEWPDWKGEQWEQSPGGDGSRMWWSQHGHRLCSELGTKPWESSEQVQT